MIKSASVCFVLLALVAGALSEAQFISYPSHAATGFFRSGLEQPSELEGRFFLGTRTLTLATSTSTTTVVSTTTCTTSTAALSTCVASGGRRRRNNGASSALFYDESTQDDVDSIFLIPVKRSAEETSAPVEPAVPENPATLVPFVVQPGMAKNANLHPQARFLLALTTFTTVVTTTSTSTTTMTAICSSNTSFQLCGSSGK